MSYRDQYRCRRCTRLFSAGSGTSSSELVWSCIVCLAGVPVVPNPGPMAPLIFYPHECEDGGLGLADFIGWSTRSGDQPMSTS